MKDKKQYHILIIEDNPGDLLIVEELLWEHIENPVITNAKTFRQAITTLTALADVIDVVLLDLTLPDKAGESLVSEILYNAAGTPVVVLTGFADIGFSMKSISLGISDYLLKDDLSASILYKSILYALERKKYADAIKKADEHKLALAIEHKLNKELAIANEKLTVSNTRLEKIQETLYTLNDELEERVLRRTKDLSASEERFRAMAEGTDILITLIDQFDQFVYLNRAWLEFTGSLAEDLPEFDWTDYMHPDDKEHFSNAYRLAFQTKSIYSGEFRLKNKDGDYRWLLSKAPPRFNADGSFAGYIMSSVDITDRKLNEQRKNDFIGMVSHELKTPLTSLNGFIQILFRNAQIGGDAPTVSVLEKAGRQIRKMTEMINGFLNISRLELGKLVVLKDRFLINNLIEEVIRESYITQPSHVVTYQTCGDVVVCADRDKIESTISNLLSNAIKYSAKGSTIYVNCEIKQDSVYISIRDEGIGIHSKDVRKIFERYYRSENNNMISGFGLGLYLCSEIVKLHEGKIWAESETGRGSTFCFSLPLAI